MKNTLKNTIITMLAIGLLLSTITTITADEPNYDEISISPEEPTQLSELTLSVDITGETITEVFVKVEECIEGMCYPDIQNISMQNTEGNTWEATVTLIHDDAVYGTVWLIVNSNGTWYDFSKIKEEKQEFDISPSSTNGENGENGENGGNGDNGTPGFELLVLVVSIIVALSIYKKKRMR